VGRTRVSEGEIGSKRPDKQCDRRQNKGEVEGVGERKRVSRDSKIQRENTYLD